MKGITGKIIVIVIALIIVIILLALFWTGMYKMVPFLSNLVDGIMRSIKGVFCAMFPWPANWFIGC